MRAMINSLSIRTFFTFLSLAALEAQAPWVSSSNWSARLLQGSTQGQVTVSAPSWRRESSLELAHSLDLSFLSFTRNYDLDLRAEVALDVDDGVTLPSHLPEPLDRLLDALGAVVASQ